MSDNKFECWRFESLHHANKDVRKSAYWHSTYTILGVWIKQKVFKPVCAFGMILVRDHSLCSGKAQAIILNPSSVQDLSHWPDLLYLSNPKYRKSKFQQWWFVQWHIGCCISRSSVWYTGGCPTRTTRPLEFIWYLSGFRGLCNNSTLCAKLWSDSNSTDSTKQQSFMGDTVPHTLLFVSRKHQYRFDWKE